MGFVILLLGLLCVVNVNAEIKWKSIEEAISLSKTSGSPILLLSVRKNCKPCKKLLEQFNNSEKFLEESKKYVLAKAEDAAISKLGPYKTKGNYVPKVTFINSHGIFISELDNKNKKSEKTKYFYKKVEDVLESMAVGLKHQYMDSGFGTDYIWYDWEGGLVAAKKQNKPILVIFHQEWCGACKRLKPIFAESKEIKEVADKFIMINTDEDKVVKDDDKYKVDGEYYPKILFLNSDGEVFDKEINWGTKHKHVLHYYGNGPEVRMSMDRVLGNITEMKSVEDKGFGKHINWVTYQKGLKLVNELKKPMMLIITKSYCGACKALKPKFRNDKQIAELSKKFVMVQAEDDDEPDDDQFDQDGAYIPRIFFLDSNGKVEPSIYNHGKSYKKSRFAYGSAKQLIEVMKQALDMKLGERSEGGQQQQQQSEVKKGEQSKTTEQKTETTEFDEREGFAYNIKWFNYTEGVREAKKSHKIGMVVFHNNYCMFSKFMKDQFNESPEITDLSPNFVMIKVSEDEAKLLDLGDKYDVDGTYTPRLFFIDPDQNVRKDINNTGTHYEQTMFYYGTADEIVASMKSAIEKINVTLGRGFGEYIEWVKYEKALEVSKEKNMPMMIIIHKTWCGACKALKPTIKNSRPIWEMSKYFVMVNVEDAEEPVDNQFFIDGGYYPRIYFLDSNGKVQHDLHNRDPKFLKYKYSYAYEDQILHTMKFAVGKFFPSHAKEEQLKEEKEKQETEKTKENLSKKSDDEKDIMLSPGKKLLKKSGGEWKTIDVAMKEAKETKKPIMFLVHRTTCPACKATIKLISRDEEFKEKAEPFILADIEDDVDETLADSFDVDGTYVPRIYFLDPEGKIFKDIWNVGTNYLDNKFYYFEISSIHRAMEKVKLKMKDWTPGSNKTESPKDTSKLKTEETKENSQNTEKTATSETTESEKKKDEL